MKTTIIVYGKLTEILGSSHYPCDFRGATAGELRRHLENAFPQLEDTTYFIAVDGVKSEEGTPLNREAEIALVPPYSGG